MDKKDRQRKSGKKGRRKRRSFDAAFKAEAVRLCKVGDRSIAQVAVALDLTETALREWVKRADIDAGEGPPDALTTDERAELARLRRETNRLTMEREILKKAAAFFAKENS
jgi:transposase